MVDFLVDLLYILFRFRTTPQIIVNFVCSRLRLQERRLRKRVARDYNLVNVYTSSFRKGQPGAKKRGVREYKEYQEKMKKFCQFISLQEHDRFFNSLQSRCLY